MHVDAYPDEMVGQTVDDAAGSAFPVREARKLAVGIVKRVCADVQGHARDIETQIVIEIEVSGDNSKETAEKAHPCRRHLQFREEAAPVEIRSCDKNRDRPSPRPRATCTLPRW